MNEWLLILLITTGTHKLGVVQLEFNTEKHCKHVGQILEAQYTKPNSWVVGADYKCIYIS